MAEDEDLDEDLEGEAGDEELEGVGGRGGKKKLFILIGAALLLVIGGVATAYFTGLLDPLVAMIVGGDTGNGGHHEGGGGPEHQAVFYDMDEILVNLNVGGRKQTFLKIRVSLELANPEDQPRIEMMKPKIVDAFEVYLRELRVEDLKGSAGMYRLREELLTRVNAVVAPAKVNDVLFKEMLVQ